MYYSKVRKNYSNVVFNEQIDDGVWQCSIPDFQQKDSIPTHSCNFRTCMATHNIFNFCGSH